MKKIRYNKEKDTILRKVRNIGFKDVIDAINSNHVLAVLDHPNKKQFSKQKIFVIEIGEYIYMRRRSLKLKMKFFKNHLSQ